LYRCRHDRRLAGVAAGVAEYFDLDPTLVRVVWFVSIFFGGLGLFLYIAMALIVPDEPLTDEEAALLTSEPAGHRHAPRGQGRWSTVIGLALILLGGLALVDVAFPLWDAGRYVGPLFIVGLGTILVATAIRREPMQS
jgi:phage shock protein PspC (stress-responsive transcriptional regulator)